MDESNNSAICLYEKIGFRKISIREKYYNKDSAIIMSKSLHNN